MTPLAAAALAKLYVAFFDRAPDASGFQYWLNSNLTLNAIASSFAEQPEAQALYGNLEPTAYVTAIYRNVFNRDPDAEGLAYWVAELAHFTPAELAVAMLNGAQGDDALLLNNKAEIGLYYVAHGDGSPNAWQVLDRCGLSSESVQLCKDWIDGKIPANVNPGNYVTLNDAKQRFDVTGTSGDDVFVVKKLLTATIDGGYGEDTVDFSKLTTGIKADLSTGFVSVSAGMYLYNVEHLRGTAQADVLVGNAENNILVAGGGRKDSVDGSLGDDRILFENMQDVQNALGINGGQGMDTLEITSSTTLNLMNVTNDTISDIEVLQVGYSAEDKTAATTIKVGDTGLALDTFQIIRGTESYDTKGRPADDLIVYAGNGSLLDVSNVVLESIEGLENRVEGGKIRVNAQTLESVEYLLGAKGRSTTLELAANAGDTFNLSAFGLTGFDRVQQLTAVETTLQVNQKLVDTLSNAATIQTVFAAGGFGQSALEIEGGSLNLSKFNDGDYNFRNFVYNQADSLILGQVENQLTFTRSIKGSESSSDYLSIVHDLMGDDDLTSLTISDIERLDVENVRVLKLDNDNLHHGVEFLFGNELSATKTLLDASKETAEMGLDLRGVVMASIGGVDNIGTFTLDLSTVWDGNFTDLGMSQGNLLLLAESGNYNFSQIKSAQLGQVTVEILDRYDDIYRGQDLTNDTLQIVAGDILQGSAGDDAIQGGQVGFAINLGKGNDQFMGTSSANECVVGGEGNDRIDLGDNNQGEVILKQLPTLSTLPTDFTGKGAAAYGGDGDDIITSGQGDDVLFGGGMHDSLSGGEGQDLLSGGEGDDILSGGGGNDWLAGGAGNDTLQGDAGNDLFFAGRGVDVMRGGTLGMPGSSDGQDKFFFTAGDSGISEDTVDTIADFYSYQRALNEVGATAADTTHDVIYLDWYADGLSADLYAGAPLEVLDIATQTGVTRTSGQSYDVLFSRFNDPDPEAMSLWDAANLALDRAYKQYDITALLVDAGMAGDGKADYTSMAVQFYYGGSTYLAIDAYVNNAGIEANNFNADYDLLLRMQEDSGVVNLSGDSDGAHEIIVTRWDIDLR